MGIITRYVRWISHTAAGTLPPVDVVAGIVQPEAGRIPQCWLPLGPREAVVYVPSQWIGEWESGHTLAPAYQYLWRAPCADLYPLPGSPLGAPYRPGSLPASATGPRSTHKESKRGNRES